MPRVIVASTNPVKLAAVRQGFGPFFSSDLRIDGQPVDTGVSEQPMTDAETLRGAHTRAANARSAFPEADFWVGIEGGVQERQGYFEAFGWVVVLSPTGHSEARSATFLLPEALADALRQGHELGPATDQLFGGHNTKHHAGTIGMLSREVILRDELYRHPVVMALLPFLNPEWYPEHNSQPT